MFLVSSLERFSLKVETLEMYLVLKYLITAHARHHPMGITDGGPCVQFCDFNFTTQARKFIFRG